MTSSAFAQMFKTQKQALEQAFPAPQRTARKVLFLTEGQKRRIEKLAKVKVDSKLITYYVGSDSLKVTGYAFFDMRVVRTKSVTFVVVLQSDGRVKYVEILAFHEPLDYLPTRRWLELFKSRLLSVGLWPKRDIANITGATLSARAITQGVRKTLAIYQVAISQDHAK
ncbi:MAG: FMN-binding protein [bacterium]